MLPSRRLILAATSVLVLAPLAASGAYAWYLHSGMYRQRCAQRLETRLGLPVEIGRVVPLSRLARGFENITVWLPGRRDRVHHCGQALVRSTPRADDPNAYEIELRDGTSEISTRTWLREDYRDVLNSTLRPGFVDPNLKRVRLEEMDLRFVHEGFQFELNDAAGSIEFVDAAQASAVIRCRRFNSVEAPGPALLTARFTPRPTGGVRVDELQIDVPLAPIAILGLQGLGLSAGAGNFQGQLRYSEALDEARPSLVVSGRCDSLDLAEWTAGWDHPPVRGECPAIQLDELRMSAGNVERLAFRGALRGVSMPDLLAWFGVQVDGGVADVDLGGADLAPGGIRSFVASGRCRGVSLQALTGSLGRGVMTGTLLVRIDDLTIRDDKVVSLDAQVEVEADNQPHWIESKLLQSLAAELLHFSLPPVLPERIEYTNLGLRIEIRDERLRLFGGHGPGNHTILTARILGRELPVLFEPPGEMDVSAWCDKLRQFLHAAWGSRWDQAAQGS